MLKLVKIEVQFEEDFQPRWFSPIDVPKPNLIEN
jgi:hypothetical protein